MAEVAVKSTVSLCFMFNETPLINDTLIFKRAFTKVVIKV